MAQAMARRSSRVSLGTLIAAALVGVAPVVGVATPAWASSETGPCQGPPYTYQLVVARGAAVAGGTGTDYYGAIGDTYVRTIAACTSPTQPIDTAVVPANVAQSSTGYIVQVGYAACSAPGSYTCGGIPSDGSVHFFYVCVDNSQGVPCLADSWAGTPIVGDRYRFEVLLSGGSWLYSIKNETTGAAAKTTTIPYTWNGLGDEVFFGGEAHDRNSMLGPTPAGSQHVDMDWMQYRRTANGTAWFVAWPNQLLGFTPDLEWPSWYQGYVFSQNYTNDAAEFYTEPH